MYGLKSQQRLANIDAGVNEFHSHSGQSMPPFGWFHWAALWEICSVDKHGRISLKAKDVKCYAAAGIVQELARPKSEPDSEVVRVNRNPKSTESLQFCPVSQCIVPQPSHWCFWISAFPTLLDSEVPLHFHTWLAASNSRIRFFAWCPNCHLFSLASTKQYTKRIKKIQKLRCCLGSTPPRWDHLLGGKRWTSSIHFCHNIKLSMTAFTLSLVRLFQRLVLNACCECGVACQSWHRFSHSLHSLTRYCRRFLLPASGTWMLNGTELMIQHYGSFSNYDTAVLS